MNFPKIFLEIKIKTHAFAFFPFRSVGFCVVKNNIFAHTNKIWFFFRFIGFIFVDRAKIKSIFKNLYSIFLI